MIAVRKARDRGLTNIGWLKSYHTFSFGEYYDPKHMNFRSLRVINEDWVKGGKGFDTHPHRDMEIITYVLEGSLEHKDSMGNGSVIKPGEVQLMRAGTGVAHSEHNHSKNKEVHLYQIWILPDKQGLKPDYQQKEFPIRENHNRLHLVVSKDGRENSLRIHQDADLFITYFSQSGQIDYLIKPNRYVWFQVAKGKIKVNETLVQEGDGLAISAESKLEIRAQDQDESEFLLFDLT